MRTSVVESKGGIEHASLVDAIVAWDIAAREESWAVGARRIRWDDIPARKRVGHSALVPDLAEFVLTDMAWRADNDTDSSSLASGVQAGQSTVYRRASHRTIAPSPSKSLAESALGLG